jgi:hypothetical protein
MTGEIKIKCKHCNSLIDGKYSSTEDLEKTIIELYDLVTTEAIKRDWVGKPSTLEVDPVNSSNFTSWGICSEKCHQQEPVKVSWFK